MNQKSRIVLWAGAAAALVAAATLAALWAGPGFAGWNPTPRSIALVLAADLSDPSLVAPLTAELRDYESLNPGLRVSLQGPESPSAPDVAVLDHYPNDLSPWVGTPTPWTGEVWTLAANREGLNALGQEQPMAVASLRAGTLDAEGFLQLTAAARARGSAPLTLGNSYFWPFLVWLQAWTAATLGPDAAVSPPTELRGPYPQLAAPMTELRRWKSLGWFNQEAWTQGWAEGLVPVTTGKALFALVNPTLLAALTPEARGTLEFLPFPRRKADPPWSLGSVQLLAQAKASGHPTEAAQLLRFLTSPGVTQRLSQATGRPFFGWNLTDSRPPRVLANWAAKSNEPAVRELAEELTR